jgi:WD40 repeat protein
MKYHHGSMSLGCTNPEVFPGRSQGDLLTICESIAVNAPGRTLLRRAGGFSTKDELGAAFKAFSDAKIVDGSVPVRLTQGDIRSLVAPNLDAGIVAAFNSDDDTIDIYNVHSGAKLNSFPVDAKPLSVRWRRDSAIAVLPTGIEILPSGSGTRRSFHATIKAALAATETSFENTWIALTHDGRVVVLDGAGATVAFSGQPLVEVIEGGGAFDDASGAYAYTVPSTKGSSTSPRHLYVHTFPLAAAIRISESFDEIVAVASVDAQRVAVVSRQQIVIADRLSGVVLERRQLPAIKVQRAFVLSRLEPGTLSPLVHPYLRLLLITDDDAGFIYESKSQQLQQLALAGGSIEDVHVGLFSVAIASDAKLVGGFTHALVLHREGPAPPMIFNAPREVGGRFDFMALDTRGLYLSLSENSNATSVFSTAPQKRSVLCDGLTTDNEPEGFFHLHSIDHSNRIIAVAEHGICILAEDAEMLQIPTEFPIEEFVYSSNFRTVVVGHDGWGLFAVRDGGGTFQQLVGSVGEIDSIATSSDGKLLFATVDGDVRVWGFDELALLVPTTSGPNELTRLDSALRNAAGQAAIVAASSSGPLIAVGLVKDGNFQDVVLANYATGQLFRVDGEWTPGGIKFAPDGRHIAVLSPNKLRIYDATFGALRSEADGGNIAHLKGLDFDQNGSHVLAVPDRNIAQSKSNVVRYWKLPGDTSPKEIVMPTGVRRAVFNQRGDRILVQDDDGRSILFDVTNAARRLELKQHEYIADYAMFADDDRLVITGDPVAGVLRVFDARTGSLLLEHDRMWGESVNNSFGTPQPLIAMIQRNILYEATQSGVVALPFYFDLESLRAAARGILGRSPRPDD